jgi:hypothetical protein
MTDPTIPSDDDDIREVEASRAVGEDPETDRLAPEAVPLEGWLPEAEPTDGPAPAP